jgi:aminopeptidase-like protein
VTTSAPRTEPGRAGIGREMHALVSDLFPICRSITGDGVRETLRRLGGLLPLEVHEVPSGTAVFDWTVPPEWNIRDAWIEGPDGRRVVDFRDSSLHVLNYSVPVRARLRLAELREHLHTLPERPDWIPYRTSYYQERWGFCLRQRDLDRLPEGEYEVCVDSTLAPGHLTYGEYLLPGRTKDEVLLSCHVCHPSLANDNLAGVTVATFLARALRGMPLRYSYRFLFIPGTIGSITWLARHQDEVGRIKAGLVLACLGDPGAPTYKKSRRGDTLIDRAVGRVLRARGGEPRVREFSPYGYDERQYCSPGFDLPVGCLTRTPHGEYPEYHSSADDLELVRPEALADSLALALEVVRSLEADRTYVNLNPKCEPQLGRRGLYRALGGLKEAGVDEMAMLWVLNLSDGRHGVLEIAERSGYPLEAIDRTVAMLVENGLLAEAGA